MDAAPDLLHLLHIQRHKRYNDGKFHVGGFALLTTVKACGATQRIVHIWDEDRPGMKIEPAPIDWSAWKAEWEPGLSGLKRERVVRRQGGGC